MNKKFASLFLRLVCAAMMLTFLAGCEEDVNMNTDFSIHLVNPGPEWPKKPKKLEPTQQEVLAKYGKPDMFRVFYNKTGAIQTRGELGKEMMDKQPKKLPPQSWIYTQRGIEVVFEGNTYREQPLTDQVRLIIKYGDPEEVKASEYGGSQWMYFSAGKLYKFSPAGRIIEEKTFPGMGSYIKG